MKRGRVFGAFLVLLGGCGFHVRPTDGTGGDRLDAVPAAAGDGADDGWRPCGELLCNLYCCPYPGVIHGPAGREYYTATDGRWACIAPCYCRENLYPGHPVCDSFARDR